MICYYDNVYTFLQYILYIVIFCRVYVNFTDILYTLSLIVQYM